MVTLPFGIVFGREFWENFTKANERFNETLLFLISKFIDLPNWIKVMAVGIFVIVLMLTVYTFFTLEWNIVVDVIGGVVKKIWSLIVRGFDLIFRRKEPRASLFHWAFKWPQKDHRTDNTANQLVDQDSKSKKNKNKQKEYKLEKDEPSFLRLVLFTIGAIFLFVIGGAAQWANIQYTLALLFISQKISGVSVVEIDKGIFSWFTLGALAVLFVEALSFHILIQALFGASKPSLPEKQTTNLSSKDQKNRKKIVTWFALFLFVVILVIEMMGVFARTKANSELWYRRAEIAEDELTSEIRKKIAEDTNYASPLLLIMGVAGIVMMGMAIYWYDSSLSPWWNRRLDKWAPAKIRSGFKQAKQAASHGADWVKRKIVAAFRFIGNLVWVIFKFVLFLIFALIYFVLVGLTAGFVGLLFILLWRWILLFVGVQLILFFIFFLRVFLDRFYHFWEQRRKKPSFCRQVIFRADEMTWEEKCFWHFPSNFSKCKEEYEKTAKQVANQEDKFVSLNESKTRGKVKFLD